MHVIVFMGTILKRCLFGDVQEPPLGLLEVDHIPYRVEVLQENKYISSIMQESISIMREHENKEGAEK
jgi:hypothetical protein